MCYNTKSKKGKHYQFMQNKDCEWFPCHTTENIDDFNCIFCFCPLYYLEECNGTYTYTKDGIKDCKACVFPHKKDSYEKIINVIKLNRKKCGGCNE